jgi:hypothetical protein
MSQEANKEPDDTTLEEKDLKEITRKAMSKAVRLSAIQKRQPNPNRMQKTDFTREQ